MKFVIEIPDKLIKEIEHEGPEIARMNMTAYLETETIIYFSRLFRLEGYLPLPKETV